MHWRSGFFGMEHLLSQTVYWVMITRTLTKDGHNGCVIAPTVLDRLSLCFEPFNYSQSIRTRRSLVSRCRTHRMASIASQKEHHDQKFVDRVSRNEQASLARRRGQTTHDQFVITSVEDSWKSVSNPACWNQNICSVSAQSVPISPSQSSSTGQCQCWIKETDDWLIGS